MPGTCEGLAADIMAFHPDTTGSLVLHAPFVNPTHRETPGDVPASTQRRQHQEFQLWTGSLPAPCPPGIILCLCPALISSPAEKQGKPHGLAAGSYHAVAAVSFPLALPCHPAGLSPDRANNPPLPIEGLSTPKSTLTLPSMGPSGITHNPSTAISAGRGFTPIWMSPSGCHQSQKD